MDGRRIVAALALALAACAPAASDRAAPAEEARPASAGWPGGPPSPQPSDRIEDAAPLLGVDLSDAAVDALDLAALWSIGVERLGWPAEPPAGVSRHEVHQRLLDAKYRHVADSPIGY